MYTYSYTYTMTSIYMCDELTPRNCLTVSESCSNTNVSVSQLCAENTCAYCVTRINSDTGDRSRHIIVAPNTDIRTEIASCVNRRKTVRVRLGVPQHAHTHNRCTPTFHIPHSTFHISHKISRHTQTKSHAQVQKQIDSGEQQSSCFYSTLRPQ